MATKSDKKKLSSDQRNELMQTLRARFEKNTKRHEGVAWKSVQAKLDAADAAALWSLHQMEATGGEPDVVRVEKSGDVVFCDCAAESPSGRRSLCYDEVALRSRKENKPKGSALGVAEAMGVAILTPEEYRALQELGKFDQKTSSWVETAADVRSLGGALFGDYRYGRVFIYHNGAESYYAARGFRASLRVR